MAPPGWGILLVNGKSRLLNRLQMSRSSRKKSIVFVCPDYHCSFLYRDELRKRGWRADIYVPAKYPKELLYDSPDLVPLNFGNNKLSKVVLKLSIFAIFIKCLFRYRYHFYYGRLEHFRFYERQLPLLGRPLSSFRLHLFITKLCRRYLIYIPSGTPDEVRVELLRTLGNDEEGVAIEDSRTNQLHLSVVSRYSDLNVGLGFVHTREFSQVHFQYKCLDLKRWTPNIEVPSAHLLPTVSPSKLRVLHSFMFGTERQANQGGNIKGTRYVIEAINRLRDEGIDVELMMFDRVPSRDYIYIQAQADIVVEELIRGCWGSTAVECLALGKPVLTFIRPEWETMYLKTFPSVKALPIVNTNKNNVYDNLKTVILNDGFRRELQINSRKFAEEHFDVLKNTSEFERLLIELLNSPS